MRTFERELLAPAGNKACLHAAVTAGADAVYLGVEGFNARRSADNFTLETLAEACDYAHVRGVKVYLALNTLVLPSEVPDVLEIARQAYRRGVDAFIVQDIGLAAELKRIVPACPVHASTQMNIHTVAGIEAVAALGVTRVTLARELSLEEVAVLSNAADALGVETEAFVHGALCVCYSGQCLFSSLVGGRSANRGLCAQACRLPYTLHNKAIRKTLPAPGEHLLSPKDLCALDLLPQLVAAGVASFKIEGRMKSPEYVRVVTGIYRKAIDAALREAGDLQEVGDASGGRAAGGADGALQEGDGVSEKDRKALAEVFSRGFTEAYLLKQRGNDIMSYGRPNNRGIFVGRVTDVHAEAIEISCEEELRSGDVLEIWTNKGHFTHTVEQMRQQPDGTIRLPVQKRVGKGDRVFRVRNAAMAFNDDPYEPRVPVVGKITLRKGEPLRIRLAATPKESKVEIEVVAEPVEAARTKAVEAAEVREHVGRFGNTPFVLENLEVEFDEGVGIGFSRLHKVRAQALETLQEALLEPYAHRLLDKAPEKTPYPPVRKQGCAVVAWATNPACARAAKKAGADSVYVPALFYKRGQAAIAGQVSATVEQAGYPKQCVIALPIIDRDVPAEASDGEGLCSTAQHMQEGKPLFVENIGNMKQAADAGALVEVGPHIPLLNRLSLEAAAAYGVQRVWLSPELTLSQIEELGKDAPVALGLTVMGAQELMVTEHCLLMSQGPCEENCPQCQRRMSPHYLKDRKGYELPVITDVCGRSHLYNAVPFDAAHAVPELICAGITALMVDTTLMNVAETTKAVQRLARARDIGVKSGDRVSRMQDVTSGHLFRGVK